VGAVRIRWSGVGKVAIVAVAALLALQALPGLLRPPQPPPLGKDVGLPQVPSPAEPSPKLRFETHGMRAKGTTKPKSRGIKSVPPGRDVISSRPRKPAPPAPSPPAPITYEPPPTSVPAPPPPPAGDGSEEFAPR
jgi:hypothetical protein